MSGTSKGFTFIEITVAIAIMGVMAAFIIPRLFQRPTVLPLDAFVTELSALVQAGVVEAISSGHAQRVMFDFDKAVVKLETLQKKGGDPSESAASFKPTISAAANTEIMIPDSIKFRQFFVGNEELLAGARSKTAWFFINAEGVLQEVTLVISDTERDYTVTLQTNPFMGNLVMYEGVRRP